MKIAYVTTYDARNPRNWSGLGYHIARALEQAGCQLDFIGPLHERSSLYYRAKTLAYRKLKRQAFQRDREPAILTGYAHQIEQHLKTSDSQIIFSPGTVPIAHLKTERPIVFWSDATYAAVQEAYRWELLAAPISLRNGHAMEQRAIDNAAMAIYSSQWAADSAIHRYHANPAKIKVVPFGANIDASADRNLDQIRAMIARRPRDLCRLLFIGVGWERKGGDTAIAATKRLNEIGVKAELNIVGSLPPETESLPPYIHALGFLDKSTSEGRAKLESLLAESHFLILPARAEAFGLVLCEANSFGLPCLTTNIGGIPTIIRNNLNGLLFPPESPNEIASGAAELFSNQSCYTALAESSFAEYQARLNWRVAGQSVRALLEMISTTPQ